MSKRCMCGDSECPSCGTAQGTFSERTTPSSSADDPEGLERAARIAEYHAERLRHTSHRDGLGMGWQEGEELCREIAARIRASTHDSNPSEP